MQYKSYLLEQDLTILKENFALFYGENLGLKNDFKTKIKENNKTFEIIKLVQEDIIKNKDLLFNEISNGSLFKQKKIFLIDQANDKIANILEELFQLKGTQKIYIFSDILEKKSKLRTIFERSNICAIIPCYLDNEISIKKIINFELKGYDGLSPQIMNLIVLNSKLDRSKLKNELDKIKVFFYNKKIEFDKLEILLNIDTNEDFSLLKNQALLGNKTETNKLLSETTLENEKAAFYIQLINLRISKLYDVIKSGDKNIETTVNNLRPPIFWKDKPFFLNQVNKWSIEKIRKLQKKTYDLELQIKSNSIISKELLMKKLIIDICHLANS